MDNRQQPAPTWLSPRRRSTLFGVALAVVLVFVLVLLPLFSGAGGAH